MLDRVMSQEYGDKIAYPILEKERRLEKFR